MNRYVVKIPLEFEIEVDAQDEEDVIEKITDKLIQDELNTVKPQYEIDWCGIETEFQYKIEEERREE